MSKSKIKACTTGISVQVQNFIYFCSAIFFSYLLKKKLLKQNLCVKGIIQKIQNSVKPTRRDERIHKMCSVYYRCASSENICSSYYITDVFSARSLRKR